MQLPPNQPLRNRDQTVNGNENIRLLNECHCPLGRGARDVPGRLAASPPGEWGRLLGLDRCPAPDVLRRKIAALAEPPEAVRDWLLALAAYWCSTDLEVRAALFFDGHVKVYTGQSRLTRTLCVA